MKRKVEGLIDNWYKNAHTPHLYITGMRGTGKTTLITDYLSGRQDQKQLYINFETDFEIRNYIFRYLSGNDRAELPYFENRSADKNDRIEENSGSPDITGALASYFNTTRESFSETVIMIDELHTAGNEALFFSAAHNADNSRFIFIDSEEVTEPEALPDNFTHIRVNPLTFDEFLDNTGKEWYHEVIEGHFERNRAIPELVHNEINDIYADYLSTGGMPVIVKSFLENAGKDRNLFSPDEMQLKELRNILMGIEEYESSQSHKMISLLENTVSQYIDDNRHFILRRLLKGTSNTYYAEAIRKLCGAGILIKNSFGDHFRLFWSDTGLLAAKIKASTVCDEERFNEIISRNYLAQHLYTNYCNNDHNTSATAKSVNSNKLSNELSNVSFDAVNSIDATISLTQKLTASGRKKGELFEYWCSGSNSEVDFIIDDNGRKKAIKYIGNSKKKIRSLQIYEETTKTDEKTAVGYNNFYIMGTVKIIPQYAVFCL